LDTLTATASRPPSLRVNFSWTFAGNMAYALSQWGIFVVLARLGSDVLAGMYGNAQGIAATVMAVAMLQLRSVQITDARSQYPFADYFGARIVGSVLGFTVIAALAFLAAGSSTETLIILWLGVIKALESISDIVRGLFQKHERMDHSSISLALKGPLALLMMAAVMWMTGNVVISLGALAAVYALSFLSYDLVQARHLLSSAQELEPSFQRVAPRFDPRTIASLTWIALPLGMVLGLITLQIHVPRFVLRGFVGEEAVGYFTAMTIPMQVGQMVVGALGLSAAPRLSRYYMDNRQAYARLVRKLVTLAAVLALGMVFGTFALGRPFLRIYGAEYANYHWEFVLIACGASLQLFSSGWGYALTAARRFHLQVVLIGTSCASTAIAAFAFVPRWGVTGAAIAVLISSLVGATLLFLAVRSAIGAPRPLPK
jgi:O-antigen/teichoic acid export membrane protein